MDEKKPICDLNHKQYCKSERCDKVYCDKYTVPEQNVELDEKKLVEKMVQKHYSYDAHETARRMLSVVKANIGAVAKKCPECDGGIIFWENDLGQHKEEKCEDCHGTGVIAKDGAE